MITKQLVLAGCAAIVFNIATAQAGPCNTGSKSAQDAGVRPMPSNTGQTIGTGSANSNQRAPTDTMNRAGDAATSTQDAQMQGQPTTTQPAQGAEPSAKMTDRDQPPAAHQAQDAEPSVKMADQDC